MITYVLTKHLQPSQTFVVNEIAELRRQGLAVDVLSVERGDVVVDDATYLVDLAPGRGTLVRAHLGAARRRPVGYLRFLVRALAMRREMGTRPEQVPWLVLPLVAATLQQRGTRALHAHFAWSGAAAADLLAALTGLPWSVTLHAKDIFSKQRHLQRKLADADHLVTVCRYNEQWMREHVGLTRPVAQVVCGVEAPPVPWPREGAADVVAVGRLVPKKGFDTLLRAAALLRETRPGLTVDVVGDGPGRAQLEALVDELGLHGAVRLLGARPHEESLARIAGARVFCLPCRIAPDGDRDSMPVVIKEAMVRGVPVVSTDVVAVPEMLDDGCGLMVAPDDPRALAEALGHVLADEVLAARLAAAGRRRALERFLLAGEVATLRALLLPQGPPGAADPPRARRRRAIFSRSARPSRRPPSPQPGGAPP